MTFYNVDPLVMRQHGRREVVAGSFSGSGSWPRDTPLRETSYRELGQNE